MKKLLIMCIFGLVITTCACGEKNDKDSRTNDGEKADTVQENEISQEEQKETIDDWNEILGVNAEDDRDTEDGKDIEDKAGESSSDNGTATTDTTANMITDDTEGAMGTEDKEEEDSEIWTKDY